MRLQTRGVSIWFSENEKQNKFDKKFEISRRVSDEVFDQIFLEILDLAEEGVTAAKLTGLGT